MDDKVFREIDKELDDMFTRARNGDLFNLPFRLAGHIIRPLKEMELNNQRPPQYEWVPIGIYNGIDLPGTMIFDDSYIVWQEIEIQ